MGDVGADAGVLRDLDAVWYIPLRPAARSFAGRCPGPLPAQGQASKGESLDPGPAFYQQPRYITPSAIDYSPLENPPTYPHRMKT